MKTIKKTILLPLLCIGNGAMAQWNGGNPEVTSTPALIGGTGVPVTKLEVRTATAADGITVNQTNAGSCAVHLDNNSTGGTQWSLYSLGSGDGWNGAGTFAIRDVSKTWPAFQVTSGGDIYMGGGGVYNFMYEGSSGKYGFGGNGINNSARMYLTGGISQYGAIFQNDPTSNGTWEGLTGSSANFGGTYTGTFIGLDGYAYGGSTSAGRTAQGVLATATLANLCYGIYATAYSCTTSWAGYFAGNVYTTGTYSSSDKRFKKDVQPLTHATDMLQKINGYRYSFNTTDFKDRNFEETEQIGLIAQEIQEVYPQLVKDDGTGYLTVNYSGLIPVLVEGFKEQQKQIEELKALVHSLAGNAQTLSTPVSNVSLSDKDAVVLNQNVPNPFAESTVITYTIPGSFGKAQMLFSTSDGKIIRVIDITTQGEGRLNVFANDLSTGIYTYTLVVDGKTIDTKRMIKE